MRRETSLGRTANLGIANRAWSAVNKIRAPASAAPLETEKTLVAFTTPLKRGPSHFRRQVPIGPYVADFACMAARLVIELDGSQHNTDAIRLRDQIRTRWLESEGFRVIRFWNNDLTQNMDGVLETVYAALYGSREAEPGPLKHRRHRRRHPTPARFARRPSPSRGG